MTNRNEVFTTKEKYGMRGVEHESRPIYNSEGLLVDIELVKVTKVPKFAKFNAPPKKDWDAGQEKRSGGSSYRVTIIFHLSAPQQKGWPVKTRIVARCDGRHETIERMIALKYGELGPKDNLLKVYIWETPHDMRIPATTLKWLEGRTVNRDPENPSTSDIWG